MVAKGLCMTCAADKKCSLRRKLPVWFCEEFTCEEAKKPVLKKKK